MRASFRPVLACSLALALGLPGGALAAPSKPKSPKSATTAKDEGAAKDPAAGSTTKDPGDPSVPPVSHDGPPRVGRVFVDADAIASGGAVLAGRAKRAATGGLESQAVTITEAPAGPELRVKLTERDAGGYRVEYEIVYDGKTIKNGTGGFDCQFCTENELIEKVEALAIQVAPKLVVPEPEPEPGPGPGPDVGPKPDDGDGNDGGGGTKTDGTDDLPPEGLGVKGKAGIALIAVGGAGLVSGLVMALLPPQHTNATDERASQLRDYGDPGIGVLAGGAALLITGAVLLGVDRAQAKKRGKSTARVHPWLGPQGAGLGVVGRF